MPDHAGAIGPVGDVQLVQLERQTQMRAQQPDLVTVPGDRVVVEEHGPEAICSVGVRSAR